MVKTDITKMTVQEIAAFLQKKTQRYEVEKHTKALKAKKEVEAFVREKYGLTLQEIFTVSDKVPERKTYRDPHSGHIYTYAGRGKVPAWLRGPDGKPNPQYEVHS
jgi:DNA-binding protein H-NS